MRFSIVLPLAILLTGSVYGATDADFVIQNDITIVQGADLYLHLNFAITTATTCKLYGPGGEEFLFAETDPLYPNTCAYIVRSVTQSLSGTWIIEYGIDIKQRGSVNVNVVASEQITTGTQLWNVGDKIDITLGPENAVYCKIEDAQKRIVFDHFGQCRIAIERVAEDHAGTWYMHVAVPGSVVTQTVAFQVSFKDEKAVVTTSFRRIAPSVIMSCTAPHGLEVNSCTFTSHTGETFVAAHGVGENGVMFNGSFSNNYESSADSDSCSLRLLTPTASDLGIWRCGMMTSAGTYFGYLTVLCPWLMTNTEITAAIVTEPVLQSEGDRTVVEAVPTTMRCAISAEMRYCSFRHGRTGTIFNVFPTMSSSLDYEYVGSGLDAGECGIHFKNGLTQAHAGAWSCHAGLLDSTEPEQRVNFNVEVQVKATVHHYWHPSDSSKPVVEAAINHPYTADYCRFIRIDGLGFTSDNMPAGYEMANSGCTLYTPNTILDLHTWYVAIKFTGIKGEVTLSTTENMMAHLMPGGPNGVLNQAWFWVLMALIVVISAIVAFAVIPMKNRKWTQRRASGLRDSFRHSWDNTFKKQPIDQLERNEKV